TPIPNTPPWYRELYEWCWYPDPAYRPTAEMVKLILTPLFRPPNDRRIRDHPAISQWLSLCAKEREKQVENTPWPGGLHPPPLYDGDMFTSKAFKTLDTEVAEATQSENLKTGNYLESKEAIVLLSG